MFNMKWATVVTLVMCQKLGLFHLSVIFSAMQQRIERPISSAERVFPGESNELQQVEVFASVAEKNDPKW